VPKWQKTRLKIKKISGDFLRFWQIVARKQAVKFGRLFPLLANSRPKTGHEKWATISVFGK